MSIDTFNNVMIVVDIIILVLLLLINVSKELRYKQFILPLLAISIYFIGFSIYYLQKNNLIIDIIYQYDWMLSIYLYIEEKITLFFNWLDIDFTNYIWVIVDTFIIGIFLALKLLIVTFITVKNFIIEKLPFINVTNSISSIAAIAYENDNDTVVVKEKYVYFSTLFKVFSVIFFFSLIAALYYTLPHLLSLPFLVLIELGLFLDGKQKFSGMLDLKVDEIGSKKVFSLENLFSSYVSRFKDRIYISKKLYFKKENFFNKFFTTETKKDLDLNQNSILFTGAFEKFILSIENRSVENLLFTNVFCDQYEVYLRGFFDNTFQKNYKIFIVVSNYKQKKSILKWLTSLITEELYTISDCNDIKNINKLHIILDTEINILNTFDYIESLEKFKYVVTFDTLDLLENNLEYFNLLLNVYRDKVGSFPNLLSFSDQQNAIEDSFNQLLVVSSDNTREIVVPPNSNVKNVFLLGFKSEGSKQLQSYYEEFNAREEYFGKEVSLSYLSWKQGVSNIVISSDISPIGEELEELSNELADIELSDMGSFSKESLSEIEQVIYKVASNCVGIETRKYPVFIIYDNYNFIDTVKKWNNYALSDVLLIIVSPPYLLRDYFADNIKKLLGSKLYGTMLPTGKMNQQEKAFQLLYRLYYGDIDSSNISLPNIDNIYKKDIMEFINKNHDDIIDENQIRVNFDDELGAKSYTLSTSAPIYSLHDFTIVDDNNNTLDIVSKNDVYLKYLPGMLLVNDNKVYHIDSIDSSRKTIIVSFSSTMQIPFYGIKKSIKVSNVISEKILEHRKAKTDNGVERIITSLFCDFETTIDSFYQQYQIEDIDINILDEEHVSHKNNENVLMIKYKLAFNISDDSRMLFIYFLDEVLKSLFPDKYHLISVKSLLQNKGSIHSFEIGEDLSEKEIKLFVFENSSDNLKLLSTIHSNFDNIIQIILDYLEWKLQSKNDLDVVHIISKVYGYDMSDNIDYDEFNKLIIYLSHAKSLTSINDISATEDDSKNILLDCDMCRDSVGINKLNELDDGRMICDNCQSDTPKDRADYIKLIKKVKDYLKDKYGIDISEDIEITVADRDTVNKNFHGFIPPNDSLGVQGFATKYANGKGIINMLNGCPMYMAGEILAHEMTHIWQFNQLNFSKISDDLVKVEGLAHWVGLTYIEDLYPQYSKIVEREKNRDDEYGQGYAYVDKLLIKETQSYNLFDRILQKKASNPFEIYMTYFGK